MDFKKYTQSATVIGVILTALFWFHSRIDKRFDKIDKRFEKIDERFVRVEKDMGVLRTEVAIIKTVLIMQDMMPKKLVSNKIKEKLETKNK